MLDPEGRTELISLIHRLKEEKDVTIISITHDLSEAIDADHLVVLNQGSLYQAGLPQVIFNQGAALTQIGLDLPFAMRMSQQLLGVTDYISYERLVSKL